MTLLRLCFAVLFVCSSVLAQEPGWPTYGGDAGGGHYSAAEQITRSNVPRLRPVWTYHTHALDAGRPGSRSAAFESTPVLFRNTLYVTTPFSEIHALDPVTGAPRWVHATSAVGDYREGGLNTSRGVAAWQGPDAAGLCSARIFVGTLPGSLFAVDADTGKACEDFGVHGSVDLNTVGLTREGGLGVTSAPTVVGDAVLVGSTMPDNYQVSMPEGVVRAFDVRSGRLLWSWDPIPWGKAQRTPTGAANAWATIAADPALGIVYIPTGSAAPDYYGGTRPGDGRDADSVVALEAATGRKLWAFQVVHHDLWDYDIASEPVLFTLHGHTPAIAVTTKMGMVFVLDRRTGVPLYPVEERPVPHSDVPGETASPTQPFSSLPPFSPLQMPVESAAGWQRSPRNAQRCRDLLAGLRDEGIYTPPSERGSLMFPGNLGGVNWGGAALDRSSNILYANSNRAAYSVKLIRRPDAAGTSFSGEEHGLERQTTRLLRHALQIAAVALVLLLLAFLRSAVTHRWGLTRALAVVLLAALGLVVLPGHRQRQRVARSIDGAFGHDHSPMFETPYELVRDPIQDYDGAPCVPPPWGGIAAIDLETGQKLWEQPLSTINLGGPMVTAGGLVFTAATKDAVFRAFDARTGEPVWQAALPVPAQSTPMSYRVGGRQFVVIAAGGHGLFGTRTGDSLIAYALE